MEKKNLNIYTKTSKKVEKEIDMLLIDVISKAIFNFEEFQEKLMPENMDKIA